MSVSGRLTSDTRCMPTRAGTLGPYGIATSCPCVDLPGHLAIIPPCLLSPCLSDPSGTLASCPHHRNKESTFRREICSNDTQFVPRPSKINRNLSGLMGEKLMEEQGRRQALYQINQSPCSSRSLAVESWARHSDSSSPVCSSS